MFAARTAGFVAAQGAGSLAVAGGFGLDVIQQRVDIEPVAQHQPHQRDREQAVAEGKGEGVDHLSGRIRAGVMREPYSQPVDAALSTPALERTAMIRVLHVLDHSLPLHSGYTFRTRAILKAQEGHGLEVRGITGQRHNLEAAVTGPCEEADGLTFHRTPGTPAGPPALRELGEIEALDRFREPPEAGLMSDLLWSDPQPQRGRAPSKRGLGFSFGPDYTEAFLRRNNLQLVIRSHEVRDEGYEEEHGGKVITVFSAPNYCDQMGNKGAYIRFGADDMTPSFTKFVAAPHPNVPPMRYAGNMFSL